MLHTCNCWKQQQFPLRRYRERAELWRSIGAGLCVKASAYRIYVFSVLLYVAQLERVPPEALQQEEWVLLRLVSGPRDWMTAPALQSLKDLGFNFEFASLGACATAFFRPDVSIRKQTCWRSSGAGAGPSLT